MLIVVAITGMCYGGSYAVHAFWPIGHLGIIARLSNRWADEIRVDRSSKEQESVLLRLSKLQEHVKTASAEDWTGEYERYGRRLCVVPSEGFAFYSSCCMGPDGLDFGIVEECDGSYLRLQSRFRSEFGRSGAPVEWICVRWGRRHYLVPAEDMVRFCKEATDLGWDGYGLLRQADRAQPMLGVPDVLESYRALLTPPSVQGRITWVGRFTSQRVDAEDQPHTEHRLLMKADLGTEDGIIPGTQFRPWDHETLQSLEATEVGAAECTIQFVSYLREGEVLMLPEVGWSLMLAPSEEEEARALFGE